VRVDLGPRGGGGAVMARRAGKKGGEAKVAVIARRIRKEQLRRCAGHVSAAHVREQRRLSPRAGGPRGSRRRRHSEPIRSYRLFPYVHDVQRNIVTVEKSTIVATDHREE
jgi:hypothetical protein